MALTESRAVEVGDPSGPAEARRVAVEMGRREGFDEQDLGRIALVVTELCTNLVKHAPGGWVVLAAGCPDRIPVFQVVALDKGPGFAFDVCRRDGHSTAGTPGSGLGAVDRLSEEFDAYTPKGGGSVLFAEVRGHRVPPVFHGPLLVAGVSVPKEGEEECGDAWTVRQVPGSALLLLADGIGHGPDAAMAAREAVREFSAPGDPAPAAVVGRLHAALRHTRGATVGVAAVEPPRVRFAGVGNIVAAVVEPTVVRHLVSHNGTAGREARRIQEFAYDWPGNAVLVMASDGLGTRWDLGAYLGLLTHHPGVIAGVLYRDFARGRDDVTVVVARARSWRGRGGAL